MTAWRVDFSSKAAKQVRKLPESERSKLRALVVELMQLGPVRGTWPNYSKLGGELHHCHLSRRYVAVWEVVDRQVRIMEMRYVGSREKAPY
jgi:Cytotoxic translational repressor of toxin-antitoxin stability system